MWRSLVSTLGSVNATLLNDVALSSSGSIVNSDPELDVTGDTVILNSGSTGTVDDTLTIQSNTLIVNGALQTDLESGLASGSNSSLLEQLTENVGGSEGC